MNNTSFKAVLWLVFLGLLSYNIYTVVAAGYGSVFPPFGSISESQMFLDLSIALGLFQVWMYFDLRKRGKPLYHFFCYLIGTIFLGSLSPLLYLILRK